MMVVVLQHRPGFPLLLPGVVGRAVVLRFLSGRAAFPLLRTCGILVLSPGKGSVFWSISSLLSRGFPMPENPCGHGVYIQVHFSTFLGHCGNPYGSRRFALQCRWARFVLGRVLWYTCLRPRAMCGFWSFGCCRPRFFHALLASCESRNPTKNSDIKCRKLTLQCHPRAL